MFFASPGVAIVVERRRLRFRFDDFFVRMWLLNAFMRFTLPDPVIEKRFFAPLWVFIFGIAVPFYVDPARMTYFGARIMVMNFPSNFGSLSIFETSASSVATRFTT